MQTSGVTHAPLLKPSKILQYVTESEEDLWKQTDISQTRDDLCNKETLSTGSRILRHGRTVKLIHKYFGNLEPRKCCLYLTSCKTTFNNVRLVRNDGRDSGIEEGAMMRTPVNHSMTVTDLDENDFRVFRCAYLCASLPVLGAPEPPSAFTPTPVFTPANLKGRFQFREIFNHPPTPQSLQDSGVEDQDDTCIVQAESLREVLMRTFHLTPERFYYYEQKIASMYSGKQSERILAEELVGQLAALENNNHPFYSPDLFMHTQGYDKWQRKEFLHIGELLKKFWHHSYPPPNTQYIHSLRNVHSDYVILMEKLIRYESPYRQAGELLAPGQTSPLSTTSVRLLKEFGLRYGIGEHYRRIVYLNYLVNNFDATASFIQHTGAVLTSIMDMLPKRGGQLVLVKKEHSLLGDSIQTLETQVVSTLTEMKSLFPNNKPSEGLDCVIELASRTLQAKRSGDSLDNFLLKNIKNVFPICYNREKMVIKTDLSKSFKNSNTDLTPTLLNLMIGKIRDEVNDYKLHYQATFEKFFDVTCEAAQCLYKLLMEDIKVLCNRRQSSYASLQIDKLMLGLGYRLHQLDQEWSTYISKEMQTWREMFVKEEMHWSVAVKVHLQQMVVTSVSYDDFDTDNVPAVEGPFSISSNSSLINQRVRTISTKSLTQSVNSAFSGLVSSTQSTPIHQKISRQSDGGHSQAQYPTIQETDHNLPSSPQQTCTSNSDLSQGSDNMHRFTSQDNTTMCRRRSTRRQHSYEFDTKSLEDYVCSTDESLVSFTCIRQSNSLPDVLSKSYDHNLSVPRKFTFDQNDRTNQTEEDLENVPEIFKDDDEMNDFLSSHRRKVSIGEDQDSLAGEFSGSNSDTLTDPKEDGKDEEFTASERSDSGEGYAYPPIEIVSMDKKQMEAAPVSVASQGEVMEIKNLTSASDGKINTTNLKVDEKPVDEIARTYQEMKATSLVPPIGQSSYLPSCSDTDDQTSAMETSLPVLQRSTDVSEVPVSSSLIDLVAMIQRLVGFSRIVCQTFCPFDVPTVAPVSDYFQSLSCSLDDMASNIGFLSDTRQKLYNNFFDALSNTLCAYADNMLCMDLCGTTLVIARKLVGPQFVDYLKTQQQGGLVSGCRHDNMKVKNCFQYINKKTDFLCDRYEPVTRDMCVRINNIAALLEYLDSFHSSLGKAFSVYNDWTVYHRKSGHLNLPPDRPNADYEMVEKYSYNPESDRHVVMETASQITNTTTSSHSSHTVIVQTPTKPCHDHLKAILRALSRIMAYRLNLFVSDALSVLLGLKHPEESIGSCLLPLTKFLQVYINSLQNWLYPDCFRRVVECLWIFIVQDFEEELRKLKAEENTEVKAKILIQALSHLLRFVTLSDKGIGKDLLLSQAEDVMFSLQLFTESSSQLITLFNRLKQHYLLSDSSSTFSLDGALQATLHRMRRELEMYCKCFSGHALVEWISSNAKLFANIWDEVSTEKLRNNKHNCKAIAQWLLDEGLLIDTLNELQNPFDTTMTLNSYEDQSDADEYPALSIHSSMHGLTSGDSDPETPQASPRNSPIPTRHSHHPSSSRVETPVQRIRPSSRGRPTMLQKCLTRKGTPLPKFGNLHLSGKPEDFSFMSITSSVSEISNIECADGSVHPDQVKVTTGGATGNQETEGLLNGEGHGFNGSHAESREISSLGENRGFLTPRLDSMLENVLFQDDQCHFYHISTVLGSDLHSHYASSRDMSELNSLIEQCFLKKIVPDDILTILYSRRKEDAKAKLFYQRVMDDPNNAVRMDRQNSTCVTS